MSAIDTYVAGLDRTLRGPRRAKVDLLTEARDSLVDATEAHERRGVGRERAERLAVAEFGEVAAIAPEYQTELGLTQSRRTAWLLALVVAPQHLVWDVAQPMVIPDQATVVPPGHAFEVVGVWTSWLGTAALVGAILTALACGIGVRYVRPRPWLVRFTAAFTFASAAIIIALGLALALLSNHAPLLALSRLPWVVMFVIAPMLWVAASARRCRVTTG